jgi:hypothetical protein
MQRSVQELEPKAELQPEWARRLWSINGTIKIKKDTPRYDEHWSQTYILCILELGSEEAGDPELFSKFKWNFVSLAFRKARACWRVLWLVPNTPQIRLWDTLPQLLNLTVSKLLEVVSSKMSLAPKLAICERPSHMGVRQEFGVLAYTLPVTSLENLGNSLLLSKLWLGRC